MGADQSGRRDARHPRRGSQRHARSVPAGKRQPRGVEPRRPGRAQSPRISPRRWIRRSGSRISPISRKRRCAAAFSAPSTPCTTPRCSASATSRWPPIMRHVEKDIMLKVLDQQWRDHLGAMDYLRQGIHLRGYAQKDYRYEYKREAFELFAAMLERIKFDTVTILATLDVQVKSPEQIEREEEARRARLNRALQMQHAEAASLSQLGAGRVSPRSRKRRPAHGSRRRCRPCRPARNVRCAPRPRSGATSRAPAAAARSSRTATACSKASSRKWGHSWFASKRGRGSETPAARGRRGAVRRATAACSSRNAPTGKHMAGWWEFPGGKVASGESDARGSGARVARRARSRCSPRS